MDIQALHLQIRQEIGRVIAGHDSVIDLALVALLSGGHVLIEGVPGTAKTLLVKTVAAALKMSCQRVQMTPDLLPNDITGAAVFRPDLHTFEFRRGPLFANFVLADEINRASARTQSALLEAMQEQTVTQDGVVHALPQPFIVFATQNPVEQEGTYPLPLAQLDRFMFKIIVDYPEPQQEEQVLKQHHATGSASGPGFFSVNPILEPGQILAARETIRATFVRDEIISYVRKLVQATRSHDGLAVGASPRAGLLLLMAAKGIARMESRDYVTPDDLKEVFLPVMRHRVVLAPAAELEGARPDEVLGQVLESAEVPR